MSNRQKGHVSSEWAAATFIMVIALFAPIPGGDKSLVGILMIALRDYYANMSLLLSLP